MGEQPDYHDELFCDEDDRYWVTAELRSAGEAVEIVNKAAGPFGERIECEEISARIEETADGPKLTPDPDGDYACWQIDAA